MREDGAIHQVLKSRLEITVEISVAQNAVFLVLGSIHVHVALQYDVVLRQGARLVGTENVHGTEILNGVQILYDGLLARHDHRSFRKVGGNNHRQHLGGKSHGHGDGEDEGLHPVALRNAVDQEHDRYHYEHEADEQQTHLGDSLVESRGCTMARHVLGDGSQIGVVAGGKDDAFCRTAHHVGPHEADVVEVNDAARMVAVLRKIREFLDGI